MDSNKLSRKDFLKTSALAFAGITASNTILKAVPTSDGLNGITASHTFKNVRLETGFEYEDGEVVHTKTDLFIVEVENGRIKNIRPNDPKAKATDAKGLLMLPAFRDMHIHLDKTFYGDKWQAVRRRQGGVKGMIALEQQILPEMLKTSTYKAEKLVELLQSKGTSFARSHVNIEPTSKLDSLTHLQKALENKKQSFSAELVAFPQHGIYYTDSAKWMKEAAKMDIDFIGGLDPYSIDGSVEKPIDFIVQLALDNNKGIDIHLHETGDSGLKTVEYLVQKVNENPALKGKTFISHCFVLGKLEKQQQEDIAAKLGDAQVGIISTIPFGGLIMPIPTLYKHNVNVATGNDSIVDHWNTWGSGSVLEKAKLMAQLYGYSTEFGLSRSLKLATHNLLPLDDNGKQQWPKPGDKADMVLIDASCSAEAVSRISPVRSLIHNGNIVY
ncbi:Cytosine/adenosine deaminase [Chitinophaga terrae (ex Kim and Jung 2007)]|uniref:Cytosine/adenosine deaminase n=1 Tax=Chitinophaga terrae (ex Kim and Jung 2007) TaxID=408074 RepID=A0A1H4DRU7_9BACT|nr:amidohydrolase [Chitinophaga terrae (ex Kim and Jung 2007)]MDQ0110112.1 cytosine/adenosine deaminase-related metal-dependent hydrolase [Chitinophaga terrae (ex Kim and Jung 2007)]GEP91093.1 deaminase [Chitinophaga terrae (ex Kim and Jung 2007)]SEA75229.1 Cytosine/adenosine deaminase [Chitinophaga terrae (ex Kim and Jung 2007)]